MRLKMSKNFVLLLVTESGNPLRTRNLCGSKRQQEIKTRLLEASTTPPAGEPRAAACWGPYLAV